MQRRARQYDQKVLVGGSHREARLQCSQNHSQKNQQVRAVIYKIFLMLSTIDNLGDTICI